MYDRLQHLSMFENLDNVSEETKNNIQAVLVQGGGTKGRAYNVRVSPQLGSLTKVKDILMKSPLYYMKSDRFHTLPNRKMIREMVEDGGLVEDLEMDE